jgi:hypothetical protein
METKEGGTADKALRPSRERRAYCLGIGDLWRVWILYITIAIRAT